MQQLLASLLVSLSVKDAAFSAGMATARKEAARTGQDVERSATQMETAIVRMARSVDQAMISMANAMEGARQKLVATGAAMTVGLTVPIALAGKAAKDTASDFEAAMNEVRAAMVRASPDQIKALSDAAMSMGPQFGKSASEAANAIERLAKAGLDAADILDGGLKSALTLSVVGQTDLGRATAITTDIMSQFGRKAGDLPAITDRVVGALDATKLAADDYAQAIGQVGGIAGGLGYSFEDTNVAISALAPAFDSGSSAGTALKSMLLQLKPTTKDAEKVMESLGKATIGTTISFFDAQGKAKTFAETAEILRQTFGRLNEESKRQALTKAFGSDGMAAAIALMKEGSAGMEQMRRSIDSVTAGEKLSVLMQGDAKASERLANAVDALSIKLGDILLPVFTAVKNAAAAAIQWLADLPPAFHYVWVATGTLVAALGPLVVAIGVLAKVAIPLLAMRFAAIPLLIGAILNPMGLLIGLIAKLAIQLGVSASIALFAARLATMATGIGLVIAVATVLIPLLMKKAEASKAATAASRAAAQADAEAAKMATMLATAQGKARVEAIAKAKADRAKAHAAMIAAQADMQAARAAYARAKADGLMALQRSAANTRGAGGGTDPSVIANNAALARIEQAKAEFETTLATFSTTIDTKRQLDTMIASAEAPIDGGLAMDFGDDEKKKRKKKGRDAARDEAAYLDEMGRLRVQALEAQAELSGGIEKRYEADMASIEEDRAAFARNVKLDEGLTNAKRATLIAANEAVLYQRDLQAEQDRSRALEADRHALLLAANEAQQEELQSQIDAADSVAARRSGQLRLLDLQKLHEAAMLDEILATKDAASVEYANAQRRRDALDAIYAEKAAGVRRDSAGSLDQYRRDLNRSSQAVNESIEAIQVSGFERLNDWMTDAVMGADNLAKAFSSMAKSIIADLVRIMIQQQLIKPLVSGLGGGFLKGIFGGGSGGADLFGQGAGLKAFTPNLAGLSYGGGKASGGRVSAGRWYMVGENGPEPFIPDGNGTIMPTGSLKGAQPVATIRIVEDEGFASRVVGISGEVSVQTARASSRRAVMQQRQKI